VTPGNIDGPLSEYYGRGGWTWYTGSSQWLHRVATHWILGIRPQVNGLLVAPSIPAQWTGFQVTRQFRNAVYKIEVQNPDKTSKGVKSVTIDGKVHENNLLPVFSDGKTHSVKIVMG
jgi:cellobiose phosphorylase